MGAIFIFASMDATLPERAVGSPTSPPIKAADAPPDATLIVASGPRAAAASKAADTTRTQTEDPSKRGEGAGAALDKLATASSPSISAAPAAAAAGSLVHAYREAKIAGRRGWTHTEFMAERDARVECYLALQDQRRTSTQVTQEDIKAFMDALEVSAECAAYVLRIPQRTPEWHFWRKDRLTASNFGKACGHDHDGPLTLVRDSLYGRDHDMMAQEMMAYGTLHEDDAFKAAEVLLMREYKALGAVRVWLEDVGLHIPRGTPWCAVSSDGLLHIEWADGRTETLTIEIKCPARQQQFYARTPHKYFDQFTGATALLGLRAAKFIVWTPVAIQINHYPFDQDYWDRVLYPKMKAYYETEYVPRKILFDRGVLRDKRLDVTPILNIAPEVLARSAQPRQASVPVRLPATRDVAPAPEPKQTMTSGPAAAQGASARSVQPRSPSVGPVVVRGTSAAALPTEEVPWQTRVHAPQTIQAAFDRQQQRQQPAAGASAMARPAKTSAARRPTDGPPKPAKRARVQ